MLVLLRLVVEVSDLVVSRAHLVRHLDNQVIQLALGDIQLLVGRVQGGELSVEGQDLLLTVHKGHLALQELRSRISQLSLQFLNVEVALLDLIQGLLLEVPIMLRLLEHLLRLP